VKRQTYKQRHTFYTSKLTTISTGMYYQNIRVRWTRLCKLNTTAGCNIHFGGDCFSQTMHMMVTCYSVNANDY